MLMTYLVTILVQNVGIGLIAAGVGLSLFNSGGIVGRFLWGFAADARRSGLVVLARVFAVAIALLALFPFVTARWRMPLIYAFLALLVVVVAGWNGVFVSELLRLSPPGESARAIGGGLTSGFAGALAGLGVFVLADRLLASSSATTRTVSAIACVGLLCCLRALAAVRLQDDTSSKRIKS